MTTAARPTFEPAKGGSGLRENSLSKLSKQISSRDLPGHLNLKERKPGQGTKKELQKRDFRNELEEREKIAALEDVNEKDDGYRFVPSLEHATQMQLALKAEKMKERGEQKDALLEGSTTADDKSPEQTNYRLLAQLDVDEDFGDDELGSDFGDDHDGVDDDDPAELMEELNRIKQERAAEEERLQSERNDNINDHSSRVEEYSESSFRVKRRWDDDVPFKNCAKVESDNSKKAFLNDTVRQEFHKKFMDKYIR